MIAFKGFDKELKCRGFQFEIGKTFETADAKCCERGFHACEHPLDVFKYYSPSGNRFAEVEIDGKIDKKGDDTKVACSKLTVKAEISISGIVQAAVKYVFDRADWSKKESKTDLKQGAASATGEQGAASATGNYGAASATGEQGAASATGYKGAASATGYSGAASATGEQGIACSHGLDGRAKGIKGNWIVLSEWKQDKKGSWYRHDVKTVKIDGKKIKEDVFYMLKSGKFVAVRD